MALLHTPPKDEELTAIPFSLKNVDGTILTFKDIKGEKGTVIAFISNHCPYVRAIIERMAQDFKTLQKIGIGCCAIMPNDTNMYPDDSFENMQKFSAEHGFTFPYLIDETQDTARAYGAVCTPDIFGFNRFDGLQYRGRLDSAGMNTAGDTTKRELLDAMHRIAEFDAGPHEQVPSMGCSIKWR